jgi:uncharacterized protein YutE (UPF0331/DUF86 family)
MTLNAKSIRLRLRKLEQYIAELEKQQELALDEFRDDFTAQLAVERALQAAIECCSDIASHLVSTYGLGQPEAQRDLFQVLAQMGYLDHEYADTMGDMVSLRNRLVHLYWDVDVERIYSYMQTDVTFLKNFRDFTLELLIAEEADQERED